MKNIFSLTTSQELTDRINQLKPFVQPIWGTMNAAQMLAHCNVTYEFIYEDGKHPKPGLFMSLILKLLVKAVVTSGKPYKPNTKTAPSFIITDERNFEKEKSRLIAHINTTQKLGEAHFDGKKSHSFGKLNKTEWNNMLYKHLNHHLKQFGV